MIARSRVSEMGSILDVLQQTYVLNIQHSKDHRDQIVQMLVKCSHVVPAKCLRAIKESSKSISLK